MNISKNIMAKFLCRAKRTTYEGKGKETAPCRKKSHDFFYSEDCGKDSGRLEYYDTDLGGKNFSGEEALYQNGNPVWTMNYSGRVIDESFSGDFLKRCALRSQARTAVSWSRNL